MKIVEIKNSNEKAHIVREILADLPEWFGLPESTKAYVEEARALPLFAMQDNNEILGFITLKETSHATCEIHCMGVKKRCHRTGIGKKLYNYFENYAKTRYQYAQVKTVDERHYDTYDRTIKFYESMGFARLEVFPELWDEWNPCLILIKSLR